MTLDDFPFHRRQVVEVVKEFINPNPGANFSFGRGLGIAVIVEKVADGPLDHTRQWLASAAKAKGVQGIMYTTWQNDYSKLEEFAEVVKRHAEVQRARLIVDTDNQTGATRLYERAGMQVEQEYAAYRKVLGVGGG